MDWLKYLLEAVASKWPIIVQPSQCNIAEL